MHIRANFKAYRRQLGFKGCLNLLDGSESFQMIYNLIRALAFVPKNKVESIYTQVILKEWDQSKGDWAEDSDNADDFLEYFERYFIGQESRRGSTQPIFPLELWNKFDCLSVPEDDSTVPVLTNNSMEAYNSR